MIIFKTLILLFAVSLYIIIGLILYLIMSVIRRMPPQRILSLWTMVLCRALVKLFNIEVIIKGEKALLKQNGNFIISNHLSYLDGIILGSLMPLVFVSKRQVSSWPLFGWMARVGGTIFIDREKRLMSDKYIKEIVKVLNAKVNILVFPEGTSTNGEGIRPFQSVFFEAPICSGAKLLPITINYTKIDHQNLNLSNRDSVFWYGQLKFKDHLFKALRLKKVQAELVLHHLHEAENTYRESSDRKWLSESSRSVILKDFICVLK